MSNETPKPLTCLQYFSFVLNYRKSPYIDHYLGNRKVLDIGCGEGSWLVNYGNWQGIDISKDMVNKCKERGLNAQIMSALELQFPDESFDGVLASQLIEHFSPDQAFQLLYEAARVLRPGGILFIATPGIKRVWNTFTHIRPYPPGALKKLLDRPTEGYIGKDRLPLKILKFHATYAGYLGGLRSLLDLVFPGDNPDGWVIVCTKC